MPPVPSPAITLGRSSVTCHLSLRQVGGDILDPAVVGAPGRTLVRLVWIRLFAGSPRQRSVRGSVTPASAFVIAWSFFCVSVLKFSSVEGHQSY